ncbi:MAG: tRNA (cytidine(34)-2'-O)-methyltransferase [Pirellulales bacterium]|nr:tRNA (cytidine(34)-2'-O)-methyltransferase [Pirellulales bacterium]
MFHVVLYHPEIAYNTGSVGRTCVALGAKLWLVRPLGFQIDDRRLRRAGLDYWQHLDWEAVDDFETLEGRLAGRRFWLFSKTAPCALAEVSLSAGDVLVFGAESRGLPASLLAAHADRRLRIPIHPRARSLNLSVAVALALYEGRRQTGWNLPPNG